MKAEQNGNADETNGQRGGMLPDRQSGDDVRGVTGFGGVRNFLHRPIAHRRIIIRDHDDDGSHDQADQ